MKNNSFKNPFPRLGDSMFDGNNDGKLDTFETIFRDAHIEEMNQYAEEEKEQQNSGYSIPTITNNEAKPSERNNNAYTTSYNIQLVFIILSIVVSVGGIILALSTEAMFFRGIILFGAVFIALKLLKIVGLYK